MPRKVRASAVIAAVTLAWMATGIAESKELAAPYDDHSTGGLTKVTTAEYTNRNYGYSVAIPAGEIAWMNAAPSPNHGIRIFLGTGRSIEVDASFDSALLGSTSAAAEDAALTPGGKQVWKSPDHLGGGPAERVGISGPGDRRRIVVAQWADQRGDNAINYVLSLETTAASYSNDKRIFDNVVTSFKVFNRGP